jgi:hypothetical protein
VVFTRVTQRVSANPRGLFQFILPGTGDREGVFNVPVDLKLNLWTDKPGLHSTGTIPSTYYCSRDTTAFREFLSRSQILICSLPSTPQTVMMLGKPEMGGLGYLPPSSVPVVHWNDHLPLNEFRPPTGGRHIHQRRSW